MPDREASQAAEAVASAAVADFSGGHHRVVAVFSPPGAGKSTFVRRTAAKLAERGPVPIVAQTNAQADDLVEKLALEYPELRVGRLQGSAHQTPMRWAGIGTIITATSLRDVRTCDVIVSTARKWSYSAAEANAHYSCGIIDEAYQMRGEALLYLGGVMDSLLVVGDPGQLEPFTEIDASDWAGQLYNPVTNAMEVLQEYHRPPIHRLPVSWRLSAFAAGPVAQAFYPDLPFRAGTSPSERKLEFLASGMGSPFDSALDHAAATGWAWLRLPQDYAPTSDRAVVEQIISLTARLLQRRGRTTCELSGASGRRLSANRVVIGVSHRVQRSLVRSALDESLGHLDLGVEEITVDTANRIQGREYDVSIVWHPLSGRRDADSFHLESGRLCVLTSRHRHACLVVGRDGVGELLDNHPVAEPFVVGTSDRAVRGWEAHQAMLEHLSAHAIQ